MTYHVHWAELVCPHCRQELSESVGGADPELVCQGCQRRFPVICGIPDLRIFPDPYISFEGDRTKARMLFSRFRDLDFAGLVSLYYDVTPETPHKDVVLNTARLTHAVARSAATLEALSVSFGDLRGESLLDVGCGTAPLLAAAGPFFPQRLGIDVAMRWLVLARRRLLELGLDIPLVAACGEAMPFRDATFAAVAMDSFLEIAQDPAAALREAHRVLQPAARLVVVTPNRFSIGPDPHIGVPAGGFLPQFAVDAIAKQRMARPPLRHLLSFGSLARGLRQAGFSQTRVEIPAVSAAQISLLGPMGQRAAWAYNALRRVPVARQALFAVGPMLHGMGKKG